MTSEEAENLGIGLRLDDRFDFVDQGGSLALLSGFDALGRDLAFTLATELQEARGELANVEGLEFAEDVRILVRRIARDDSRVERIVDPIEVDTSFGGPGEARVELELVAETGERGEAILEL